MTPDQLTRVVEYRRAGIPPARIAIEVGVPFSEVEDALDAIPTFTVKEVRKTEMDRLERLQQAVWPQALKGDPGAVDRAMRLSERRLRLAGAPLGGTPITNAFNKTIKTLDLSPSDEALIVAGRRVAQQMDGASATGDPALESKSMFLLPHLVNVLRELGATPAARQELERQAEAAAKAAGQHGESDLDQFRKKRASRRATGA